MPAKKTVELPPDCIITDRRTWERHEREVARLRSENRRMAERLQALTASNEAIRRRIEEAEEIATDALSREEDARRLTDGVVEVVQVCLRALGIARTGLNAAVTGSSLGAHGGKLRKGKDACNSASARARRFLEGRS